METIAFLALAGGIIALLSLLALHVVSAEFQPSWRMVSEYALGKHKSLLTIFFFSWAASTLFSALLLASIVTGTWAMIGVVLLFISGTGAIMGGLFDVQHKLHGLAFGLGVPFLPIAALLISYHLSDAPGWSNYSTLLLLSAHATWISVALTAVSMMVLFSGFKKAGVPFGPNVAPPERLPEGVKGMNGYANRLLVVCYILWSVLIAVIYLSL